MTADGNYNVKYINTVNIPQILKGIGYPSMGEAVINNIAYTQFYYNSTSFYSVGGGNDVIWKAPITDILNGSPLYGAQVAGQTQFFAGVYPTPIGSYYYNFSTVDDIGGDQGGAIYRAPVGNPTAWYYTGVSSPSNATHPMIYYNNTNVYLIGGRASAAIDSGSNPLSLATSGNVLPSERCSAPLVTVGSTIYMYGGLDVGDAEVNTIYSAATSNPTTWTNLGGLLPVTLAGSAGYNDGTYIWLFGGQTAGAVDVDTIYRATVGAPTTFTSVGTLPDQISNLKIFIHGTSAYLIGYISGDGNKVYKASLSDLTTWTTISQYSEALPTAVRASHSVVLDDTIYLFGGNTTGTTMVNTIQTAPTTNPLIWTVSGDTLPTTMAAGELIKTKNYLYLLSANGTTGNVYRALLTAPTTWSLHSSSTGPTRPHGKAAIINGQVFYFGGESTPGTPVSTVKRGTFNSESSPTGDLLSVGWQITDPPYLVMALPIALSRFTLIVAGKYIYILGGYTTGPIMNTTIYRLNVDSANNGWVSVGGLSNPMVNSTLVLINNVAYIIGGGPSTAFSSSDDYITYASLSDLSNGDASFTEVNTGAGIFMAEASAAVINDDIYFIGGRTSTDAYKFIGRTLYKYPHTLIAPKVPEATHSLPTVDLQSGAIGSYTSYQRTSLYPWLVTDI